LTSIVPHQALYRRWRAQTFSQIVGQEAVVETLRNAVRTQRVSHAVLFVGPRGTGKTSLARILAKAVNCTNLQDGDPCDVCEACVTIREGTTLDVLEIDAASNRGINEVRELRDRLAYPPGHLRRKVYILDEAHQITRDAWNALLKSLEEPPDFVIFMFASTEPAGFPPAILSRLQRYDVRRLTLPEIEGKLGRILDADGRVVEPEAIRLIARLAAGGMRDAESILDQLLSATAEVVTEADVRELLGLADAAAVDAFVDALLTGDAASGIAVLDRLEERGRDPRALLDQVVDSVRARLVQEASAGDPAGTEALAALARRLVAIDPDRAGIGGLRLQLELALFAHPGGETRSRPGSRKVIAAEVGAARSTTGSVVGGSASPDAGSRTDAPEQAPSGSFARSEKPSAAAPPAAATSPETESDATVPKGPTSSAAAPSAPAPTLEDVPATEAVAEKLAGTDASELTLDRIVAAWPEIVVRLSQKPAVKQLILACRPVALDGAFVSLGFPEEQAFLRDVAERKKADIEAGVAEVVGRDIAVRCVVANVEIAPPMDPDGSGYLMAEARRIFGDDLADVEEVS